MSSPATSPVVVNLNVNVDAAHGVTVFEDAPVTVSDVIVCATNLPVAHLYTGDAADMALYEFQGQDDDIAGRIVTGFATVANGAAFASALGAILTDDQNAVDALDGTAAQPFNDAGKSYATDFQKYKSFGRLALATYAHHLFGHVQATAAITNDTAIINYMNGTGLTNANICALLVAEIYGMNAEAATAVVKQVIGQDSSRATEVDNDLTNPASWQRLKWVGGDKIYVQVTLLRPTTVNVADNDDDVQQYLPAATSLPEAGITYNFEITISSDL